MEIKMKQTINFSQFCDAFVSMNRNSNFTYEGKQVLFDYLERYEEDTGEQIELDIIALCCEYHELSIDDVLDSYYTKEEKKEILELSLEDQKNTIENYLQDRTSFCGWTDKDNAVFSQF